jgi:hypothetical protein
MGVGRIGYLYIFIKNTRRSIQLYEDENKNKHRLEKSRLMKIKERKSSG